MTVGHCQKLIVNCLIYFNNHLVGSGYNKPLSPCDNISCHVDGHCVNTTHAEIVALQEAGPLAKDSVMFVSHYPCWRCREAIQDAGVSVVMYEHKYACDYPKRNLEDVQWVKR